MITVEEIKGKVKGMRETKSCSPTEYANPADFHSARGYRECCDAVTGYLDTLEIGEVSDGYHTFNELYRYRMLYNAAFFNCLPPHWVHKSRRHSTGEECFGGGWFVVMADLPTGQVSNHYEMKYWDLFRVPEREFAKEWDGHTPQEAADRLEAWLKVGLLEGEEGLQ